MSRLLLRGGRVIDPEQGVDGTLDVLISEDTVAEVGTRLSARGAQVLEMKLLVALCNTAYLDGDYVEEELEHGPEEEPTPDGPLQAADIEGHLWPQAERLGDALYLAGGFRITSQRLEDPRPHGGGLHHGA